ncbi:vacuolar protein sorting protein [Lasallia pustulata]|uniref:Vacuolar protein sorting protein n=1 Tax=Lasallia pustulata TaxID=136370 RepID=A0A1W5D3F0_9LECA|nr:vacuolar protein sorting protein [Lasallia pustulata]
MEKYSQYRDRGSGIAPFFPIPTQPSGLYLPLHIFLFLCRLPVLLTVILTYFLALQWLPIGSLGKKAALWLILGVPGIWWIDLQIDGVRRGSVASHHKSHLPQPSSVIASSSTSPIDALYLAAVFDPVFTASYPSTRLVHRISLFEAILRAFQPPQYNPPPHAHLVDLQTLLRQHRHRPVVVFPECTTTNGRGILPFSPSLLTAFPRAKIFPVSLRYTPGDISTPVPGTYTTFLWNLLSKPTHCIRVRIAESVYNTSQGGAAAAPNVPISAYATGLMDTLQDDTASSTETLLSSEEGEALTEPERKVLDKVAEALARLGRVKRVGLGIREKSEFVKAWTKQRRR